MTQGKSQENVEVHSAGQCEPKTARYIKLAPQITSKLAQGLLRGYRNSNELKSVSRGAKFAESIQTQEGSRQRVGAKSAPPRRDSRPEGARGRIRRSVSNENRDYNDWATNEAHSQLSKKQVRENSADDDSERPVGEKYDEGHRRNGACFMGWATGDDSAPGAHIVVWSRNNRSAEIRSGARFAATDNGMVRIGEDLRREQGSSGIKLHHRHAEVLPGLYAAKDKTKHMKIELVFPADIPADDFFSRIHARMNIDPATAILGWKESQERRRDPHRRLETAEDLGGAFKQLIALQKSSRRKKPVIMEIANLEVQPDGKTTKQAEKQSETAISIPELEIVKAKLTCALHPGRNRWCYVMPPDSKHPGEHIALGIEHVGLWARKVHDGEASDDCINPPNILNFDQMAEKGRAREERIARGRGQAALPPIHVHVGSGSEHTLHDINPNLPTSRTKRAREVSSDSSSSDDDDDALTITDVLQELDKKYPALQYLQYSPALAAKGIFYASSALGFDHAYYKDNVGMADGAIGAFVKRVGKMVRAAKKRNGKKRARTAALDSEKEN
ncbi:hypothetical protein B0H17DRAFT_1302112 [Mycena rosella]|uniref:Uncharacterized protein n=1 Tax=Mycena rosella TaxID=1033263 RepID=A0AAD7DB22_MYCRO|nr:hypothetical protein B0H17DRAFT_1302112 [Mycena rosella]